MTLLLQIKRLHHLKKYTITLTSPTPKQKFSNIQKNNQKTDLTERPFTNKRADLIPIKELFATLDDIVVIVIVVPVVVEFPLFFVCTIIALRLLSSPLLFSIVNLQRQKNTISITYSYGKLKNFARIDFEMYACVR